MADEKSREMTILAYHALEDKKAADISVIDIGHVSVIADYFLIASGENRNQVQAMADHVSETLGKAGFVPKDTEGYQNANWVLLDFGDLIVHIFDRENRLFYDLERIWRDGRKVAIEELAEPREEEE
jgi:ribosome-associated protein